MSRTQFFGINKNSINAVLPNTVIYSDNLNRVANSSYLSTTLGGTGINSSSTTGVAKVNAGTWSVDYIDAPDFGVPYTAGYVLSVLGDGSLQWIPNTAGETVTQVNTSPYTVLSSDMNLAVHTDIGPFTINLPQISGTRRLEIIDVDGSCGVNNITIVPFAGNTIMRSAETLTLVYSNISIELLSVSATNWHIVSRN